MRVSSHVMDGQSFWLLKSDCPCILPFFSVKVLYSYCCSSVTLISSQDSQWHFAIDIMSCMYLSQIRPLDLPLFSLLCTDISHLAFYFTLCVHPLNSLIQLLACRLKSRQKWQCNPEKEITLSEEVATRTTLSYAYFFGRVCAFRSNPRWTSPAFGWRS